MKEKIIRLLGGENVTTCRCIEMKDLDDYSLEKDEINKDEVFGIYSWQGGVYVICDYQSTDSPLECFSNEVQKYILSKLESGNFTIKRI